MLELSKNLLDAVSMLRKTGLKGYITALKIDETGQSETREEDRSDLNHCIDDVNNRLSKLDRLDVSYKRSITKLGLGFEGLCDKPSVSLSISYTSYYKNILR